MGVLDKLRGGDRRSIGRSDEVVADVLADPALFDELFRGISSDDPLVRMRAADATEKVTAQCPEYLAPYRVELLREVALIDQQEVRWHVAQMLPRLAWSDEERAACINLLLRYLEDKSKIVKTFAMQALADFAERDPALRPQVIGLLERLVQDGSPAMQSRGRKLLLELKRRGT
jgi:HEAT repeat protein